MSSEDTNITVNTPFPGLNTVLRELVSSVRRILRNDFIGAYLQGSFAIGDFDRHSDCDFIIVVTGELTDAQLRMLQSNHKRIFNMGPEWAKHLEGSYFPKAILHDFANSGSDLWYLDNGHSELIKSNHCNSVVVRWILREKGVVLSGPEPSTLIEPIPVDVLRKAILASINNSSKLIFSKQQEYNNRFYQTFIVLQYCRKLHDLYTGEVGSKRSGAEWAKENMDRSWSDLIDRAWYGRPNPAVSVRQPADEVDFRRTLQFVKKVIFEADKLAVSLGIGNSIRDCV